MFGQEDALVIPQAVGLGGPAMPSVEDLNKLVADELMEKPDEAAKERAEVVKKWVGRVKAAKKHFGKRFGKMAEDMKFARGIQWEGQTQDADEHRYIANVTQRHINQRVSALYAKNPTVVAKRRKQMDFTIWDEDTQSLHQAMAAIQSAKEMAASGMPPTDGIAFQVDQAMKLLQEVTDAKGRRAMLDRIGGTMEILFNYYLNQQEPKFKTQAKQLIRRVETCGVGYVKLGFRRKMEMSPDLSSKMGDMTERLAYLRRLSHHAMEEGGQESVEIEELQQAVNVLLQQPKIIVEEGLVFDFPRANSIIVDKNCVCLKGFIGADWIAQQFLFSQDEIQEIYGKDLKGKVTAYYEQGADGGVQSVTATSNSEDRGEQSGKVLVFEIYHKPTGQMMTVADGYDDYLTEPAAPPVWLERFWPIYVLSFNDIEDDKDVYPDSDVRLIRAMQIEHNRSREGLREHRIANRPAYAGIKGVLEEEDKNKLAGHAVNEFIEFNVPMGTDINQIIKPMTKAPIDPAVYDTSPFFDDMQKVVGAQEADFGGVSGVAATEASIAEGARISTLQSNIDDLDDFLSDLAVGASQIMLREISPETAIKIAGPGAVWPQLSNQDIAEQLFLEIEAGSSGRPNRAHEIANLERITPAIMQIPGINPEWLAKKIVRAVDDTVDISEAIIAGMPSMTALNAMHGNPQPSTGNAATDPAQQGHHGADKTANPQQTGGGGQPSYRQPADNQQ